MRLHITALGVYLFTCSMLFGQAISISDDSPAGSPVSITGTVTFPDASKVDCSITGYNHASKSIIMSVVDLKLTKPSGEPGQMMFKRDVFFKPLTISLPESDFIIASDCQMGHELNVPRTPTTPEAHARVIFLQFEDGSVWGDAKAGAPLVAQRPEVLAFLKSLKSTYSTDGPDGLEKALAKDQKLGSMVGLSLAYLRMIRDAFGISAVAETIEQHLATAERRKALLR